MSTVAFRSESFARGTRMLRTALGSDIAGFLDDPSVVEVMLNPDGRLWLDRLSGGLEDTGARLSAADGERIIRLVAHHVGAEVHAASPRVSAELPERGERFEGLLPPVVAAPSFAIRKPAVAVFTLGDYVDAGIMGLDQAELLYSAVHARTNILVVGGTSTGKTTLVNALLAEVAKTGVRQIDRAFTTTYAPATSGASARTLLASARQRWETSVAALQDSLRVQAGVVGNIGTTRTELQALVTSSQSAVGGLQVAQAGNQILALQSQQLADLTAVLASQGRASNLEAAQRAVAQDQGRERLRRFLAPGRRIQSATVTMFHDR